MLFMIHKICLEQTKRKLVKGVIMKNTKIKKKMIMSLNILMIGFLISTLSFNLVGTEAMIEEKYNQLSIDSLNISGWEWTTVEVVSTESTGNSDVPSLAIDDEGNLHIVWRDATNYAGSGSDWDIFYKQFVGTPDIPELAFIIPNPTELTTVDLDWNDALRATSYYVYRSTSYIWSVEELTPIATVFSSDYIDTVPSVGFYYYVIVAANFAGNSSHSNCQYIEVEFLDLESPELSPILPNPTELASISLAWDSIDGAIEYYIYRSDSYIWSVEGLTPIATVVSSSFVDTLPSEGLYFYVIVTTDGIRNSTHSNCEYVEYKLPTLHEFILISSLIICLPVFLFLGTRIRKKNLN
jgi:hypothetical protein